MEMKGIEMEMPRVETAMMQLIRWVDEELKLTGYERQQIIDKAKSLLADERQQIVGAWLRGNRLGWDMQTDWIGDAEKEYDETYTPAPVAG